MSRLKACGDVWVPLPHTYWPQAIVLGWVSGFYLSSDFLRCQVSFLFSIHPPAISNLQPQALQIGTFS